MRPQNPPRRYAPRVQGRRGSGGAGSGGERLGPPAAGVGAEQRGAGGDALAGRAGSKFKSWARATAGVNCGRYGWRGCWRRRPEDGRGALGPAIAAAPSAREQAQAGGVDGQHGRVSR